MPFNFVCPKCDASLEIVKENVGDLYDHINECCRQLNCTNCTRESYCKESDLINHFVEKHANVITSVAPCPVCKKIYRKDSDSSDDDDVPRKEKPRFSRSMSIQEKLPKVGDRVIAMSLESKWEYFQSSITRFHKDSMQYDVNWDCLETSGTVDVDNIAIDYSPGDEELGVGTLVLFRQGVYEQSNRKKLIRRWHNGVITQVEKSADGNKKYHGHHAKDENDGKSITFKGYSYEFRNLTKNDFRLAPNIFDIIQSAKRYYETDDTDIFLSYDLADSYKAILGNEVSDIPESYKTVEYDKMCDPADIGEFLKAQGFNVVTPRRQEDLKEVCSVIRNTKVFIGCLSDAYVANKQCCMEFQYAKTSLKKPVIPLVVGSGSHNWFASVIGMLIAGELFIHFKSKHVENAKCAELLSNIRHHIPSNNQNSSDIEKVESIAAGPTDIFLSYCWTNSLLAENAKQIKSARGSELSDPRVLKAKLEDRGYKVWLDIERIASANSDGGLYGQIVKGLKESTIVIPCISDEYSNSLNCTMEFKFTLKSLRKPIIPVTVGLSDEWKISDIGALLSTNDKKPIDLKDVQNEEQLHEKVTQILGEVENITSKPKNPTFTKGSSRSNPCKTVASKRCMKNERIDGSQSSSDAESKSDSSDENISVPYDIQDFRRANLRSMISPRVKRAPEIGDRVVSHYDNFSYYMATIENFDIETMTYTVDWDDNDPSHRMQPFDYVAIDAPPDIDDISIGSVIFFRQRTYFCNETNAQLVRYHQGEVTSINRSEDDDVAISGHHTYVGKGWKKITRLSNYNFKDIRLEDIRLPPSALDFINVLYSGDN